MKTATETPRLITVKEFARRVGISTGQVHFYIRSGDVTARVLPPRPGATGKRRHLKIEAAEVDKFLGRAGAAARSA